MTVTQIGPGKAHGRKRARAVTGGPGPERVGGPRSERVHTGSWRAHVRHEALTRRERVMYGLIGLRWI